MRNSKKKNSAKPIVQFLENLHLKEHRMLKQRGRRPHTGAAESIVTLTSETRSQVAHCEMQPTVGLHHAVLVSVKLSINTNKCQEIQKQKTNEHFKVTHHT